jgi:replicative DNA helicase Mcm
MARLVPGAVEVKGSDDADAKAERLLGFAAASFRVLVTKPGIAAHGLNLQTCARMVFVGLSDCYDEQTEILTQRGWQSFGGISLEDEIATVNPETLAMEWQRPSRVIWEPYTGEMLHFQGQRNFDLMVTPNHRLFVKRCQKRFPSDKAGWRLKYAAEVADRYRRSEWRMLSAPATASGESPLEIEIPIPMGLRRSSRSRIIHSIPTADLMRLAGWYVSEGHCEPMGISVGGRIVLSQTDKNGENRREIIDLLLRLGLSVNSRTKDITAYSVQLAQWLIDQFGHGSANKRIPQWVQRLCPELLVLLRDTMLKGDGCHSEGVPRFYRTVSQQLADDFQVVCLKTGIRAAVHKREYEQKGFGKRPLYDISLAWERLQPSIHQAPDRVQYEGMIGCVTVPNHVVIVRRNGIPVVSGQSYEQYFQCLRRCWRYGQKREVKAWIVLTEPEQLIYQNVLKKERQAADLSRELVANVREFEQEELAAPPAMDSYRTRRTMLIPSFLK